MAVTRRPYLPPPMRSTALSEEKRKRIAELRTEGLTYVVIAERLGLHLNTVYLWCSRLGLIERRECGCAERGRPREPRCPKCAEVRA